MLEHVAIWTRDLEGMKDFYCAYFDGKAGAKYRSKSAAHPNFESYFLTFGDGSRLELMQMPTIPENAYAPGQEALGLTHIAFAVGGTDEVDGIYGTQTKNAVIAFQKYNGLAADGIAGEQTLRKLGISSGAGQGGFSSSDVDLLAKIISAESRGEPYQGQVAVGAVILNRIEHPSFPNTLAGVIYQPGAFSCLYDGGVNAAVADSAYRAARDAINGNDPSGGAVYYYNPAKSTNKWIFSRPVITVIGNHRFCS